MTTLSPSSTLFMANVDLVEQRIAQANNQISSGKRINVASDDPDQIGPLLQLRADLQRNTQIQSNLTLATADASAADNALSAAGSIIDRAVELATEGANSTQTADTRLALAEEVESLQQQMVSYSQTQVQGRYIFSGDLDGSPTYQIDMLPPPDPNNPPDPTQPVNPATLTGVDQLSNAASTRQVEDPAGGSFAVSKTAQQIFDDDNADGTPANDNVFAALNSLRLGLLANDQTAITNSVTSLQAASGHVNDMLAFYGTVENRISSANNFASQYGTQLQTEISNTEDADIPSAAMELTQANTQLEAAFQMEGKMPTETLFNYLG